MLSLETIDKHVKSILKNSNINMLITFSLLYYIVFVSNKLSPELFILLDNIFFKILIVCILFFIVYSKEYSIGLLILISFVLSYNTLNSIKKNDLLNIVIKNIELESTDTELENENKNEEENEDEDEDKDEDEDEDEDEDQDEDEDKNEDEDENENKDETSNNELENENTEEQFDDFNYASIN